MLTGHRPVTRRRSQRRRAARIAVPIAIPVALGVTLGVFFAVSSHGTTNVAQDAFGGNHHPTASASAPPPAAGGAPARSFNPGAIATTTLGDVATPPVDGTGAAINMNQTAAQAAASMNCSLAVPANPLTPTGLATPWQL